MTKQSNNEHQNNMENVSSIFYSLNRGDYFPTLIRSLTNSYKNLNYEVDENFFQKAYFYRQERVNENILEKNILKLAHLVEVNPSLKNNLIQWAQTNNGAEAFQKIINQVDAESLLQNENFSTKLNSVLVTLEQPVNLEHLKLEEYISNQFNAYYQSKQLEPLIVNLTAQADLISDENLPFYKESVQRHTLFELDKDIKNNENYENIISKTSLLSFESNFAQNLKFVISLINDKKLMTSILEDEINEIKIAEGKSIVMEALNTFVSRDYYIPENEKKYVLGEQVEHLPEIFSSMTFFNNNSQYIFPNYVPTLMEETTSFKLSNILKSKVALASTKKNSMTP